MSEKPVHCCLLIDATCQGCSQLALEIELESDWRVCVHSLHEPTIQAWLNQARPGWRWEPTLLEVGGDHTSHLQNLLPDKWWCRTGARFN
jgi:hypothetical protein